jgi:hypothetical protein
MYLSRLNLKQHWKIVSLLAADLIIFGLTNTNSVPAYVLIVGFLLLMATFHYIFYGLLTLARLYGVAFKQKRQLASSLTILGGALLALQSMGELNARDVLVLVPLLIIGYGYSLYLKSGKTAARLTDI